MDVTLSQEGAAPTKRRQTGFDLTRYTQLTRLSISNRVVLFPPTLREVSLDNVNKQRPLLCSSVTKLELRNCSVNIALLSSLRSLTLKARIDIVGGTERLGAVHHLAAHDAFMSVQWAAKCLSPSLRSLSFASYSATWSQLEGIARCTRLTGLTGLGVVAGAVPAEDIIAALPLLELRAWFRLAVRLPTTLTRLEISRSPDTDLRSLTRLLFLGVEESPNVLAPVQLQGLVVDSYSSIANAQDLRLQQVECIGGYYTAFSEFLTAKHAERRDNQGVSTLLGNEKCPTASSTHTDALFG